MLPNVTFVTTNTMCTMNRKRSPHTGQVTPETSQARGYPQGQRTALGVQAYSLLCRWEGL